jgi:hypothetical protein
MKATMTSFVNDMKVTLKKTNEELANMSAINKELSKQLEDKHKELKAKSEQYDNLANEHMKLLGKEVSNTDISTSKKTLLIGSSMVRSIGTKDSSKVEIQCYPGATVKDITDNISKCEGSYEKIIVVGGGNDCEKDSNSTSDINSSIQSLVNKAKEKTKSVTVSSILPRPKKPECHLKMDHVNENTRKVGNDSHSYEFVDNDKTFKLADMSINEAYYSNDKIHLNYHGTTKLIDNLSLKDLCFVKSSPYGQNRQPDGWTRVQRHQTVRCHNCGEQGHVMRSCRYQQKLKCFSCGSLGHKANRCPERSAY